MFGRKILFLAAGYIAGNVVSSLYSTKKGKDFKASIKKAQKDGGEKKVFLSNFFDTQKNLFKDLENLIPKKHKKLFESKKKEAIKIWNTLKLEWAKFLKDIDKK